MSCARPAPPPMLPSQALLRKVESLQVLRRDERVLLLEPQGATATVLDPIMARLVGDLSRPRQIVDLLRLAQPLGLTAGDIRACIQRLVDLGMLSVNGRVHPAVQASRSGPTSAVVALRLVEGCSPACPRCAVSPSGEGETMDPTVASEIVERALEVEAGDVTIVFTGAEPLRARGLLVSLIERCRTHSQARSGGLQLVLHTRGQGLDPALIESLESHDVTVLLVLDAPVPSMEIRPASWVPPAPLAEGTSAVESLRQAAISLLPFVVMREPSLYAETFRALTTVGFRAFRLVPGPALPEADAPPGEEEAWAKGHVELVRLAAAFARDHSARLEISPLDRLARLATRPGETASGRRAFTFTSRGLPCPTQACPRASSGEPDGESRATDLWQGFLEGRPPREVPMPVDGAWARRCGRCLVRGWCRSAPLREVEIGTRQEARLELACRVHQRALEELLWILHAEPWLAPRLGGGAIGP